MTHPIKVPRKLIEVALPLDAINVAAAREKSIRHGHPSTLHLWWARRPLAAARAVIFAQLVNDPGYQQGGGFKYGKNKKDAAAERQRLFRIIEDLVKWENTTNEEVLEAARAEIRRSWREVCELNRDHPEASELFNPEKMPGLHDPFAGGGSIPLEAQRLGLEAFASDLNPVAVLINKAMIEIPPKFANLPPVHPEVRNDAGLFAGQYKGAQGLAEDVRRYGAWMRDRAHERIGHLYPKVTITPEMILKRPDLVGLAGQELTVIAWLWARTVKSPRPAFSHVDVPLVSTFVLSKKEGKQSWVEPVVEGDTYRFVVRKGKPPKEAENGTSAGKRAAFRCLMSNEPIDYNYIRTEGQAGRMGTRMMAIVAEGDRNRLYLSPTPEAIKAASEADPVWKPELELHGKCRVNVCNYGLTTYGDLFTPRQLVALTTFSDLVGEARERARQDAVAAGLPDDGIGLDQGGIGATAYGEAVGVYLAFSVSKATDRNTSLCVWEQKMDRLRGTFGRQALPMVWDYAETNPFAGAGGDLFGTTVSLCEVFDKFLPGLGGTALQSDSRKIVLSRKIFISTDPPYYDNIGYADLSDFFYVWLRRSLKPVFPSLFTTMAVPKAEELVATPYRHGTKEKAEAFFLDGMTEALRRLAIQAHPAAPVTIYYAFKQSETKTEEGTTSTGWVTFLEAVLQAGFSLTGTWPMRTELSNRMIGSGNNALASSIILVCRPRAADATIISRREFLRELNRVLPEALDEMTRGGADDHSPVAPVDLSQAIIGPGMAVFSRYAAVLEADGTPMSVKTALQLINRFLAEDDFDHDTQFCMHWFDQYGWETGPYGEADVLARAKSTSVNGLVEAGVVTSGAGKVRLRLPAEYPSDWDPSKDTRIPVWEALHQLAWALRNRGETETGRLLAHVRPKGEAMRQLAYRLHTLCERRGMTDEARLYNELVTSWMAVEAAAATVPSPYSQLDLFGGDA